jgi:hypothetical protein
MPSRSGAIPVEVLREALRKRVGETSLRAAAEEVGLSWKGVDKILAGSDPYRPTVRKLTDWYLRGAASKGEEPSAETAQAALIVLVRHLPPAVQEEAVARMLSVLRAVGVEETVPDTDWMKSLLPPS